MITTAEACENAEHNERQLMQASRDSGATARALPRNVRNCRGAVMRTDAAHSFDGAEPFLRN